jgi:hypothetical protein
VFTSCSPFQPRAPHFLRLTTCRISDCPSFARTPRSQSPFSPDYCRLIPPKPAAPCRPIAMPPEIEACLQASRAAAKQKNYDSALTRINEALKLSGREAAPSQVISILDYRHAVHVRVSLCRQNPRPAAPVSLGSGSDATKDGQCRRRTQRRQSHDPPRSDRRPWLYSLRPICPEQRQTGGARHPRAWLEKCCFLKRDMNNISASIATERTLSRARDPIASLPLEIVGQVLSYVEHRQIVRMLRVCRSWKNLLSQLPPLTEVVAFPQTKKPITPKMLLACLRRLKNPKVVDISWLPPPSREILYGRLKRQTEFNSLVSASCALLA